MATSGSPTPRRCDRSASAHRDPADSRSRPDGAPPHLPTADTPSRWCTAPRSTAARPDATPAGRLAVTTQAIPALEAFRGGMLGERFADVLLPTAVENSCAWVRPSDSDRVLEQRDEDSLRLARLTAESAADATVPLPRI